MQKSVTRIDTNNKYDIPAEALMNELKQQTAREMIRNEKEIKVFHSENNLADHMYFSKLPNNAETYLLAYLNENGAKTWNEFSRKVKQALSFFFFVFYF